MIETMMNHSATRLKAAADPQCSSCDGEGWIDVTYNSRPDTDVREACPCVDRAPADDPDDALEVAPVARQRCYTFAVYLTAPEPVNEDDVDGYTPADVEAILRRTLAYYMAPLNKERGRVQADWELLSSAPA